MVIREARRKTMCKTSGGGRSVGGYVLPRCLSVEFRHPGRRRCHDCLTKRYTRSGNIFFTVEANSDSRAPPMPSMPSASIARSVTPEWAKALAGLVHQDGHEHAGGGDPSGRGFAGTLMDLGPGSSKPLPPPPPEYEQQALSQAFLVLSQIARKSWRTQTNGTIAGVALDDHRTSERVKLGNYILNVGFPTGRRAPDVAPEPVGYGLFMEVGPDEYLLAGNNR